eukprot:6207971-Pleurochrysis_carterae.AAC.1
MLEHSSDKQLRAPLVSRNSLEHGRLYVNDFLCAAVAGLSCAPIISAIDKAITTNASGAAAFWPSFWHSMRMLKEKPASLLMSAPFRWIVFVYFSTYLGANVADTYCKIHKRTPTAVVLASSTAANTGATIAKDRAFARMFGIVSAKPLPLPSYGAWFMRDVLTMAFVFSVPPVAAAKLQQHTSLSEGKASVAAQLVVPCAAQLVAAPLHLLGLDFYNSPLSTLTERARAVKAKAATTIMAKSMR